MPINFFENKCQTYSSQNKFGLCDDSAPATNPAYIDETNYTKWIGIVSNINNKKVIFYAIDRCITILRSNGDVESRCDGMIHYENNLTFVELKDRCGRGWLGDGRRQLTATIDVFKLNYNVNNYNRIDAYICNKQRPITVHNYMNDIQLFKNDTGLILNVKQSISIY
jgi:hypothetical protein